MTVNPAQDESRCVYGAGILLEHLAALEKEVQGVAAGEKDIEYVHRARVASRRLRAALPLFETCLPRKKAKNWLRQIRGITQALGAVRDLDVQIERVNSFIADLVERDARPGMLRLRLRLNQKRQHAQAEVLAAMRDFTTTQTIPEMREHLEEVDSRKETVYLYTPALYEQGFQAIREKLDEFLSYREVVRDPQNVTELHEMRIAAKRLRYTMETFAALYPNQLKTYLKAIRAVQEYLGDIHDCDVWQGYLETFLVTEQSRIQDYFGHARPYARLVSGIRAFEEDRQIAREKTYAEFIEEWERWEAKGTWNALLTTVQVPFPQPEAFYPPLAQTNQNPGPDSTGD